MTVAKSLMPEFWTQDQLHQQWVRLTTASDRLIREAFRQKLRDGDPFDGTLEDPVSSPLGSSDEETLLDPDIQRRSDEYLAMLTCCGGPLVHGERVSTFDFFVYLELISPDDFRQIRGEEELSGWLDRIRTLLSCGFFDETTVELARTKVQYVLRSRLLALDPDSQCWLASLRYFSQSSSAASDWMFTPDETV